MANMKLGVDAATIVIQIRNRTYTLTADTQEISIPGTPEAPKNLRFRYKDTYENAIDVGTINQLLEELQSLLSVPPPSPPAPQPPPITPFLQQWEGVKATLSGAPILGSALAS